MSYGAKDHKRPSVPRSFTDNALPKHAAREGQSSPYENAGTTEYKGKAVAPQSDDKDEASE